MARRLNPDSRFIHTRTEIDSATGAVVPPIYRATTYHQADPWQPPLYDYARSGNPTRQAFEDAIATLEGGVRGFAFASGMAALTAAFMLFSQGDHLIVTRDCQGGTQRVLRGVFSRFGLRATYADTDNMDDLEEALTAETRGVLVENFSNPFLRVSDIERVAAWGRHRGLVVMVDNTFVTPYLQNPLTLGADLVIHSATKMIGGHSDITAGVAAAREPDLADRLYFIQNACGAILSPDDAYLCHRGLRTLPVRMRQAESTARQLAETLAALPTVDTVYYPGLPTHPGYAVAKRTMRGFGQMVTVRLRRDPDVARFADALKLAVIGAGLGGTETIVSLPERHCHAALTPEERDARQITSNVLRISVGLEDPADLIADVTEAIRHATR